MKAKAKPEITPPEQPIGRPKEFIQDIFDEICDRMAGGQGLRKICDDPDMPSRQTFLRWIEKDTGRQNKYQQAREALMDWYAEEILEIAWDSSKDTIPAEGKRPARCDNEWVNRSRLKVDTLKFLMAKLHPKRYGDKPPEQEAERDLKIRWQSEVEADRINRIELVGVLPEGSRTLYNGDVLVREIVDPIRDDAGNIINASDASLLRKRIIELEERLGLREGPPQPPKLIGYDPGPLPSRMDGEVTLKLIDLIKQNVPKAADRDPMSVLDEVLAECAKALQAKYAPAGEAA
ncbi:hypothetical protein [Bradyrhizobium sp. AUGA SZCCT0431]|uniref:terminase small subunit-like protein n=1 Tax=Bradyrhizobium sp. AUGA SZCCT0431 TaxID=2807674 RepID=UPI001BAADFB1|nr:hypothetical protein [Bradyrhizobium sp. AUGA SZCCT0431]MBR1145086.1 hypothetical protein [Bradyrhizobium sp. AUGA SZCCT0431]